MPTAYPLIRRLLFALPPEAAHEAATAALTRGLASRSARTLARRRFHVSHPALLVERWGIRFPNPVGLAAGFDKRAAAFNALGALGFGFVEVGTVTAHAQAGNPRPRLFRLPSDQALLNRMGFNNPGAEAVARHLAATPAETVLGINLGKSKVTPLERATEDYLHSLGLLAPYARYVVVNVSSPNTPGLRSLQDADPLRRLLGAVVGRARSGAAALPVLLKLAPDLSDPQVEQAVAIAAEQGAAGIIAVNTTTSRTGLRTPAAAVEAMGPGGISGAPLRERALEVVSNIYRATGGQMPIVGVGGIRDAEDAWQMIRAGAGLVQLYTGWVYGGPDLVRRINLGLLRRLRDAGMASLDEAVGSAHG